MAMSATSARRFKAFTLLELSIVITIIALIAGGIVTGRTFIRNAEIATMMNEAKSYMTAFARFQEQYNAIPGDISTASTIWTGAANGDGNGMIRAGTANDVEMFIAFQHLARAGFMEGTYSGAGTATVAGVNTPRSSITNVTYLFDHPNQMDGGVSGDGYYFDGLYGHVLFVGSVYTVSPPLRPAYGFLKPEEAMSLDIKFDDGNPGLGAIVTPKQSALANCVTSDVAASAAYDMSQAGNNCILILKVQ